MLKYGLDTPCLVRHDYKRAVYRALLLKFPSVIVRSYFEKFPLIIDGKTHTGRGLYDLLWRKKALIPIAWEYQTDNHLEEFLISQGQDPEVMMPMIFQVNGGSTPIPGKIILSWIYPTIEKLFNRFDARDICFSAITKVTENWFPGRVHRRVLRSEHDDWIESVMIYIDDVQHRYYLDWDYEFITGPQIVACPGKIGLPPFESFGMLADTRLPGMIVHPAEDRPEWEGEILRIRGETWGRTATFSSFCRDLGLDIRKYNPPDIDVIVIEKDYFCPRRKRVVLHQGCAYGAPFFISRTKHRKLKAQKLDILGTLISDIDREELEYESDILAEKHYALLDSLEESAVFAYHEADESLSLNGRHFVKGIPAKIMRSLLQAYAKDGRTDFEYRDFKRDFDISLGQKNANFEVRLYRLMEKLAEQDACLRLEKTDRGRFRLQVKGIVKLQDGALAGPGP